MEEDQGRSSPPLPASGSYNIDFDALDDSFNPFQSKKAIGNSPPLPRKTFNENSIPCASGPGDQPDDTPLKEPNQSPKQPSHDSAEPSQSPQELGQSPKESSHTPRKKKTKSSKRASAVMDSEASEGPAGLAGEGAGAEGPQDGSPGGAADKPAKTKKVGKKKTRPVSKNLEPKDQGNPGQAQISDELTPNASNPPTDIQSTSMINDSASALFDNSLPTDHTENPPLEPQADNVPHDDKTTSEISPKPEKTLAASETFDEKSQKESAIEKSLQEESAEKLPETASTPDRSPRPEDSPSAGGGEGEGVEKVGRKEGKVKKKTRVKKSSGSSPRHQDTEGQGDGVDGVERESRSSPRVNTSHRDGEFPQDSGTDVDAGKSKHPAARVLEQHIREDHSLALPKGDSDMADSHGTESVVKLVQVLKYSQTDWNKLRQELELNFQAQLLAKEKEWSGKLADRDARLSSLEDTNKKLKMTNEDMRTVMGEFEKTIGQLQSEKEKTTNASQQSLQDVIKERDQALEDLQSVETAFSDLHRRYEKTKGVVDGFKQNEEMLKKCVQDLQTKLKKTEQKVQVIREQAEEKLERATEEIEKTKKSSASELAKLEAALRKADLQVQSMESTLEQKVKENKELAAICDELIAKVQ